MSTESTQANKRHIAIIDCDSGHMAKVSKGLTSYYTMSLYTDPTQALSELEEANPALVIVNSLLKGYHAADTIRSVKKIKTLKTAPIIYIAESEVDPKVSDVKEAGVNVIITKPYPLHVLIETISKQLNADVEKQWVALPEKQRAALQNSVQVFKDIADVLMTDGAVEFGEIKSNCQPLVDVIQSHDFDAILGGVRNHDDYTYAHSMRVATFLSLLGNEAGFNNEEQLMLASGGLLHDVGKMMIPHNILNKPGRLTDDEFEIMKSHVPETIKYLDKNESVPKAVMIIAEQHHEKIDGTGYPHGLKGAQLNELARMAAVVDVFSALTDRRVYKPPMDADKALHIMTEEMTHHLDMKYVNMFRDIIMDTGVMD